MMIQCMAIVPHTHNSDSTSASASNYCELSQKSDLSAKCYSFIKLAFCNHGEEIVCQNTS